MARRSNPATLAEFLKGTSPDTQARNAALLANEAGNAVSRPVAASKKGKAGHTPGEMNQNERRYMHRLSDLMREGVIEEFSFEQVTFQLLSDCRYTPDFTGRMADGTPFLAEVKDLGYIRRGNRDKFKIVSRDSPQTLCIWARWDAKRKAYREEFWQAGVRIKSANWNEMGVKEQ